MLAVGAGEVVGAYDAFYNANAWILSLGAIRIQTCLQVSAMRIKWVEEVTGYIFTWILYPTSLGLRKDQVSSDLILTEISLPTSVQP